MPTLPARRSLALLALPALASVLAGAQPALANYGGTAPPVAATAVVVFENPASPGAQVGCDLTLGIVTDPEFSNFIQANGQVACNLPAVYNTQSIKVYDSVTPSKFVTGYGTPGQNSFAGVMEFTPSFGANGYRLASYCVNITFGTQTKSGCATTAVPF